MLNDPRRTRITNRLDRKSIIDCIITNKALMKESCDVFVNKTGIGLSEHYLVCFALERNFGKSREKARTFWCEW